MTAALVVTVSQDFGPKIRERLTEVLAETVELTANSIFGSPPSTIRRIEFLPAPAGEGPCYLAPTLSQPVELARIRLDIAHEGHYFSQWAYQAFHELGHVWLGTPWATNNYLEALCMAVSLEGLRAMAQAWAGSLEEHKRGYDSSLRDYLEGRARLAERLPEPLGHIAAGRWDLVEEALDGAGFGTIAAYLRDWEYIAARRLLALAPRWCELVDLANHTGAQPGHFIEGAMFQDEALSTYQKELLSHLGY